MNYISPPTQTARERRSPGIYSRSSSLPRVCRSNVFASVKSQKVRCRRPSPSQRNWTPNWSKHRKPEGWSTDCMVTPCRICCGARWLRACLQVAFKPWRFVCWSTEKRRDCSSSRQFSGISMRSSELDPMRPSKPSCSDSAASLWRRARISATTAS